MFFSFLYFYFGFIFFATFFSSWDSRKIIGHVRVVGSARVGHGRWYVTSECAHSIPFTLDSLGRALSMGHASTTGNCQRHRQAKTKGLQTTRPRNIYIGLATAPSCRCKICYIGSRTFPPIMRVGGGSSFTQLPGVLHSFHPKIDMFPVLKVEGNIFTIAGSSRSKGRQMLRGAALQRGTSRNTAPARTRKDQTVFREPISDGPKPVPQHMP